ncbi:MAG TPA: hypothetical protein VF081_02275 [Solirubrobacterales bacterium]
MSGRKPHRTILALGLAAALALTAMAGATPPVETSVGNLVFEFGFGSSPKALPAHENVPIKFWGSMRIGTKDGSIPAKIEHVDVELDKFGDVETRGLPTCSQAKLSATTTEQARRLCPGAIVGTGSGKGILAFPEQPPIDVTTPLTFFNGPQFGADPSVIVHAHLNIPAPTTYLVLLRVERIQNGIYGFRIASDVPRIAGGSGTITGFRFRIDREWKYKGREMHYLLARCPIGRLQAVLNASFDDGTLVRTHFIDPCTRL